MDWNLLQAMSYCPYKAWRLVKEESNQSNSIKNLQQPLILNAKDQVHINLPVRKLSTKDKIVLSAWCNEQTNSKGLPIEIAKIRFIPIQSEIQSKQVISFPVKRYAKQGKKLMEDLKNMLSKEEPPVFYRNSHCPECQFRESCYKKLKDKDCISLLAGMSPKVLTKYHNKGIFSITQLSHTFRPRRRGRMLQGSGRYLWELKSLAIREHKTYILQTPELPESSKIIYLDFEGLPDEEWVYLIGGFIRQQGEPDKAFSYWADSRDAEEEIFQNLFNLLTQNSDAIIYHYGSYENKVLKSAARKWGGVLKKQLPEIEKRMVNLLAYLRTHVYPPIYGNGLKELAGYLGFSWNSKEADGLRSITWRKEWEISKSDSLKDKLLQYNQDDCMALERVSQWIGQLAINAEEENVEQVAKMKKQSPYKFQDNPQFGEDFQHITRAAYFDYQRSKIYWRNQKYPSLKATFHNQRQKQLGKGIVSWIPKKSNEIVVIPALKRCPICGHKKLYQRKRKRIFRQTDIKFTPSGLKKWVVEYQSGGGKCAKCRRNFNDSSLRMLYYGDNLFAWLTNLYVNYHISHYMISRMLKEQFGIWMNPVHMITTKHKWWRKWEPEVDYLWKIIRKSPVIHIDETTVKLSKDTGYVWVLATKHTVFYHFTLTRESDFLKDWLKDYEGVVITDFFPGYESIPGKQQKCLVHLIRDLNDDLFKNPFDEEFKNIVTEFSKLLRKIIETIDRFGLKKIHLQKHIKDTEYFFQHYIEKEHKSELAVKYTKRIKKHWDELWTFLRHDDVPWNNNNAEAAIKAFAQYRHGVNGQVSAKGIEGFLQMLSVTQTCRYRNISPLDFLRHKAGIWENINPKELPDFLPFGQAKLFVHRLKLKYKKDWNSWQQEGNLPAFIPSNPERVYKDRGWMGWRDWLRYDLGKFSHSF